MIKGILLPDTQLKPMGLMHTCTCITTAGIGYVAPFRGREGGGSQQEATRLVAPLAVGTPASSPQLHGPLSAVGVLIYGLARSMR